ncbi:hypothetical protein M434DRAFT_150867 [Hypoxylon sp. CO27-5]|nr:hypothetical protein M434DRAFT_150867 [Hypoxylon sp. CO27-5]
MSRYDCRLLLRIRQNGDLDTLILCICCPMSFLGNNRRTDSRKKHEIGDVRNSSSNHVPLDVSFPSDVAAMRPFRAIVLVASFYCAALVW